MRTRTRIAVIVIAAGTALAGCAKKGDDARKAPAALDRNAEPGATAGGAAPLAQPPRHQVLAEKVVAAIASGELQRLTALTGKVAAAELGDLTERSFRKLRARLAGEQIDLAKATISRVEVTGSGIELVDVFLTHNGRMFQLHFSATMSGGSYTLVGLADWVRWV